LQASGLVRSLSGEVGAVRAELERYLRGKKRSIG
jgi:hypothetical protein